MAKFKFGSIAVVVALVVPAVSFAQSTPAQLQAEIQALLQQVQQLQGRLAVQTGGSQSWCYIFTSNLSTGMSGAGVTALQTALQKDGEAIQLTGIFDDQTASAVTAFQEKYASRILTPYGLGRGTGYVGRATRAQLNELFGCTSVSTPLSPPATTTVPEILSINPDFSPLPGPFDIDIDPSKLPPEAVTITGTGFATDSAVLFGGTNGLIIPSVDHGNTIVFSVPIAASFNCDSMEGCPESGVRLSAGPQEVSVYSDGLESNQVPFTILPPGPIATTSPPVITSVSPESAPIGAIATIYGSNFDTRYGSNRVFLVMSDNSVALALATSSPDGTSLQFIVPATYPELFCPTNPSSTQGCAWTATQPGNHPIYVGTLSGGSNRLNFDVTQ